MKQVRKLNSIKIYGIMRALQFKLLLTVAPILNTQGLVEAQGWVVDAQGKGKLVSVMPNVSPKIYWDKTPICHGK